MGVAAPVALILTQLLVMLACPVALGMYLRARRPGLVNRARPFLRALAFGGMAALVVVIVASDAVAFIRGLRDTVPLSALFVAASFLAGWSIGAATGASPPDRFTLATEFATRNVAVAAALALTLAGRVEFAFFATAYFLTEIPLMVAATLVYRRSRQVA